MAFSSRSPDNSWSLTSGLRGLQNHTDQLRHIKVGGVVERPHVSPARAEVGIDTEAEELPSEAGCRLRISWTTENTGVMQTACILRGGMILMSHGTITPQSQGRGWREVQLTFLKLNFERSSMGKKCHWCVLFIVLYSLYQ